MALPFEVPADLTTLSAEEFAALHGQIRSYAQEAMTGTDEQLLEASTAYAAINAEHERRAELATAASNARQELAAALAPPAPAPVETAPVEAPVAETPAPAPVAVAPAAPVNTIDEPANVETERFATLTASVDTAISGQEITFPEVGRLIERRLSSYSSGTRKSGGSASRNLGNGKFVFDSSRMSRHGAAAFNRQYPADLVIRDGVNPMTVLEHAGDHRRLPGGSLVNSYTSQIKAGRSLTAAAGWCAPSETIYDLCMLETRDGILDLPTVQAVRGGFFIPEDGGPNFAAIWNGIGDDGDVILTEYDVENGVEKVCVEVPCPPFVEVRLDVAYVCITGNILQTRGYPEAVTRFSQGAMVALDHKVNASVISRIVDQSGAATTIPAQTNNTDGASQILSAAEIAAVDMRYRHRMMRTATLEIVLPAWSVAPIRAAMARRAGVAEMDVTDQQIVSWFTTRNLVPRFVYDWQDAFVQPGLSGAPGASASITALPANVRFLLYPPGTWVKAERDVINLDTVYDNALLTQNQYTALFAEDGFNVLQMCADSRLYETPLNPQGVTGQPA
jgi:hypothetical protein